MRFFRKTLTFSDSEATFVYCRICHSGDVSGPFGNGSEEPLIAPCKCKNTLGLVHESCLLTWIKKERKAKCEICSTYYIIKFTRPTVRQFINAKLTTSHMKTVRHDTACMFFLTPVAIICAVFCFAPMIHTFFGSEATLAVYCLTGLGICVCICYFTWFCITFKYHYKVYAEWTLSSREMSGIASRCIVESISRRSVVPASIEVTNVAVVNATAGQVQYSAANQGFNLEEVPSPFVPVAHSTDYMNDSLPSGSYLFV